MRRRTIVRRTGPSALGTVARTAAIAGTATVTAKAVGGAMDNAAQRQQQQQKAEAERIQSQADLEQLKNQVEGMQAPQVQTATVPSTNADLMAQLQQLAELKQSGALTDEEFQIVKRKLLSS